AAAIGDRVYARQIAVPDEHGPLVAKRERERLRTPLAPHLAFEPRRYLELVDGKFARRTAGKNRRDRMERRFFMFGGASLLPGRRGRGRRGRSARRRERRL